MSETLRGLGVGSATLNPEFSPYTTHYECDLTTTNAIGGGSVYGDVRVGQIYVAGIEDAGTSGASMGQTTNIGQRRYTLRGGTGGTEIPAGELPAGYSSGTRADIEVYIGVNIGGERVNTYTVTVHRTYLVAE